jgi:hypothetical protein
LHPNNSNLKIKLEFIGVLELIKDHGKKVHTALANAASNLFAHLIARMHIFIND